MKRETVFLTTLCSPCFPSFPQRLPRRLGSARSVRKAMSSALVSIASEAFLTGALAAKAPFAAAARAYRYAASGAHAHRTCIARSLPLSLTPW